MSEITNILSGVKPTKESKKWTYTSISRTNNVYSPINGKVIKVIDSNGTLVIKHSSGFKCKITGINEIEVSNGEEVQMNDIIGRIGNATKVTLEVLDNNNIPQLIAPFFAGTAIGFYSSRKQKPNKSEDKTSSTNKKNNKTNSIKNLKDKDPYNPGDLSFLDIALAPLHLLGAGWKYMTKKKENDEENLTEEIKRIKELLK